MSLIVSPQAHADTTSNLVARWRMNGTTGTSAVDSAGTHTGTMQAGMTAASATVAGRENTAFQFNGSGHRIDVPDNDALEAHNGMTVSLWVRFNSLSGQQKLLYKEASIAPYMGWEVTKDTSNRIFFQVTSDAAPNYFKVTSNTVVTTGTWYHISATLENNQISLFINGVSNQISNTGPVLGSVVNTDLPLRIGAAYTDYFNGILDDVRIYNRALGSRDRAEAAATVCWDPDGIPGSMIYNSTLKTMQYCNGTNWYTMGGYAQGSDCYLPIGTCPSTSQHGCLSNVTLTWAGVSCSTSGGEHVITFTTPRVDGERISGGGVTAAQRAAISFCVEMGYGFRASTQSTQTAVSYWGNAAFGIYDSAWIPRPSGSGWMVNTVECGATIGAR